jgi:phytoene dehydrogenase-like protein
MEQAMKEPSVAKGRCTSRTSEKKPSSELNPTRPHMHIESRPSHSAIGAYDATIVANEYNKCDKSMAPSGGKAFYTLQTTPTSTDAQERQ